MKQGESSVGSGGGSERGTMDKGSGAGFYGVGEGAVRQGGGGFLGGFFNPGRMAGAGIGSMVAGPIGGLLGGLIGGGGLRGWGYDDAQGNRVSSFRDMFDGGGRGRFGDTFQGGLLSNVANRVGIRPMGYADRMAGGGGMDAMQGGAGPDYVGAMAAPAMPGAASPMAVPPELAPIYAPRGRPAPMSASPDYLMRGLPAPMAMTNAPDPMMLRGGQGYAPRPFVNVGMPDIGTMRPFVSRVQPPMGLLGR